MPEERRGGGDRGASEKLTRCQRGGGGWVDGKDGAGLLDCREKTTAIRGEINNKPGQIHPYKSGGSRCCPRVSLLFCGVPGLLFSPFYPAPRPTCGIHKAGIFIAALAFARELSGFRKLVKIAILPRDVWREAFSKSR